MSYKYFCNERCDFYPCHKNIDKDNFNCLFCYCPLYTLKCNGNYTMIDDKIKDCSNCTVPHDVSNYDKIIKRLYDENKIDI
jgi:Zn-finger protein